MPTTRIVIDQGGTLYRCLRFESSLDGSLLVFFDRDPRSKLGSMRHDHDGNFLPITDATEERLPSARYTVHTTGEIHRYFAGQRQGTIYIEPLYALKKIHLFALLSIPRVDRLDLFLPGKHKSDTLFTINIENTAGKRFNFRLFMCPNPLPPIDIEGVLLTYEIYSLLISLCTSPFQLSEDMYEHFLTGMPKRGEFETRQAGKAEAELAFFRAAHPNMPQIYREPGGVYVVYASVPMARPPDLTVAFDRPDLSVEVIPFAGDAKPTHKIRFYIIDRGGRNKNADLRIYIISVMLDADIY